MITDLHYLGSNGIILSCKVDQKGAELRFEDVLPLWEYSTEEDLEGGMARVFDDKVLFTMLTASTQCGVVILWNAKTGKIEHISDGSYVLSVDMDEQYVYLLLDVFNYVTRANLQLWRVPLNCMDACQMGEEVKVDSLPSADFMIDDYMNFALTKYKNMFEIMIQDNTYTVEIK